MSKPAISLLGATYSDVSGVQLPVSGGGTALFPFVEGSETKTENGTYDVTTLAQLIVNVSGGGGLESESGTYEPSVDIVDPTISFAKTHAKPPAVIVMTDVTTGSVTPSNSTLMFSYIDVLQLCGGGFLGGNIGTTYYGKYNSTYRSGSSNGNRNGNMQYPYTDTGHTSTASACRYFATESNFCPRPNASDYWRAGRTYKWIAIWK